MKITVFTPTYNRAYIISNLYESLKDQTYRDFEWLVVDDGSNDNTAQLFSQIQSEQNDFQIRYIKKVNGGKHTAINVGVENAKGELFFIVDSDDYLPPDSLQTIVSVENSIPDSIKTSFAGVCGLRAYSSDKYIGETFSNGADYLDITTLERDNHNISGDKAEVFYTAVLRQYPFPNFEGERFLTECVVWDRIAYDGYMMRFFNSPVYFCDYLQDGLTTNFERLYNNNPKGYGLYIHQRVKFRKFSKAQTKYEYQKYVNVHRSKLGLIKMAKYLHVSPFKLLKYYFIASDIKHLPNRAAKKILGRDRYENVKNRLKSKKGQ